MKNKFVVKYSGKEYVSGGQDNPRYQVIECITIMDLTYEEVSDNFIIEALRKKEYKWAGQILDIKQIQPF